MDCSRDLSGKETALYLKEFCSKRIEKYGLSSLKSGTCCKGCPYRYRGSNPLVCCMFGNIPSDWSYRSIDEYYSNKGV